MTVPAVVPPARWWAYAEKRQLVCPVEHHIPEDQRIPEHGFIRCDEWIHQENAECGRWIFLLTIRGGGAIIAEVTLDEMQEMEDLQTPAQMMKYLGVWPSPRPRSKRPSRRGP